MGVYIKGIGLPNDYNIECYIIEPDGTVLNSDNRCVGAAVEIKEPHGDLIDRRALKKELLPKWNCQDDSDFANKTVWRELENAPTVLEGSEQP